MFPMLLVFNHLHAHLRIQACDLCYNKRIKCDAKKPRCAHCVVYDVECTFAAASRKVAPRKREVQSREDVEAVSSRCDRLEAHMKVLSEKIEKLESLTPQNAVTHQVSVSISEDTGGPKDSHQSGAMSLPPLEETLPMIKKYLATFNSILPLFDSKTLLATVKQWYWHPRQRDQTTWAAINVALALANRHTDRNESPLSNSVAEYLDNAQSALTHVIMSDIDLINVQVLVGLVMLFQGAENLRPPMVLIATALRLAHKLGLHTRQGSMHLDRSEALQRDRVFWIAYILDKDLSLRTRQPPIQLDADVDLDLPPEEPIDNDDTGFLFTSDGRSKVNFFRVRVQLACIQGNVYDCLYSARSQNLSLEQRARNVQHIRSMLEGWKSHIPDEFSANTISRASATELSRYFCILYSSRLSCLVLISNADTWDGKWVRDLQEYGRKVAVGQPALPVLPPNDWQTLVTASRDYMRMFVSIPNKDASFVWMTACTYIASLLCLLANSIHNPGHEIVESDKEQIDMGLKFVDELIVQTSLEQIRTMRDACRELQQHALAIAQNERLGEAAPFGFSEDIDGSSPSFRQDFDGGPLPARHPLLATVSENDSSIQGHDGTSWDLGEGIGTGSQAWLDGFNLGPNYVP
ncbi:fungal-specific transcription factor domain-containing protein [Thelonectria olida]|uniref:Fungal-specific transcription factor domain-containing protein n=1 Tax=Thelonectria olida TaxID=1576542 RepID=A0A9P9AJ37_9HYPO|nr:fungal-specific transcription factor domain-containing protein [Thelonectria olida]